MGTAISWTIMVTLFLLYQEQMQTQTNRAMPRCDCRSGNWPCSRFLADDYDPVEEKTNAATCEEYRTISLLMHASKIRLKVITRRLQAKTEADKCLGMTSLASRKKEAQIRSES